MSTWKDPCEEVQDDHDFKVRNNSALDEYLTTMESRGWSIVNVINSDSVTFLITFHRSE
jgi:hypothetical protein